MEGENMAKKKLLAAALAAVVMVTTAAGSMMPGSVVKAAGEPVETTIKKTEVSNPILGRDSNGDLLYGGDPSVLIDGDTLYLYTGRDSSTQESYYMLEWQCYSTKDLKTWTNEGVIMKADKQSIPWANTGTDAWAGQIEKYNGKYYFYYCTWDKNANDNDSNGKQSIGVAVSDSPTGPFVDKGEPLVSGTVTTPESSGWNDIDPTVWVEKDEQGQEHRYLSWGNGKVFACELNEDMISVKDINGDGKITFGIQKNGATSATADIIELNADGLTFTEAPWIYRRKDAEGKPSGPYYLFYAYGWREQMAYATTDNLLDGQLKFGSVLMPPAATSNTNHMAVFDFQGKTYFIYHNGSLPGGSGFRRTACITELHFNEDGSVREIPETAIGITGDSPYILYSNAGRVISHEHFINSSADGDYPYTDIAVGTYYQPEKLDASWAFVDGKADPGKASYVSIQSENKPGLYLTVNDDSTVVLAQDAKYSVENNKIKADEACAKAQTFRTVKGLTDSEKAISFESIAKPGNYLSMDGKGGLIVKSLASCDASADFYLNNPPSGSGSEKPGTKNDVTSLKIDGKDVAKNGFTYDYEVPFGTESVQLAIETQDAKGFVTVDGKLRDDLAGITVPLNGIHTKVTVCVFSEDKRPRATYTVIIKKNATVETYSTPLKTFSFEDGLDGAITVQKGNSGDTPVQANFTPEYVEGANGGKAVRLPGSYGLKLCDAAGIGENYSISYWMKPEVLGGDVDPTLAAGTFNPKQYWLNLTFVRSIWSNDGNFIDDAGTLSYEKDKWQLVTLTVSGNKAKLYVNGEKKGDGSIASNIMGQENAAVYFGVNAWDAYFTGVVDEVKIYNSTLDEAEVLAIASAESKKPEEAPQPDPTAPVPGGTFGDDGVTLPPEETTDPELPTQPSIKKVTVKAANQKAGVKTVYLKKGAKVTLAATVTGTGKFSKTVEWGTSKPGVASVKKGVVTAKKSGTAKITVNAKADKKKKAAITVKVSNKAVANKKLVLKDKKKTLKKGKTYTVAIKSMTSKTTDAVTYKSSKGSVAPVDKYGVVTAKKPGKATITVKCGKKSAKLEITVKK